MRIRILNPGLKMDPDPQPWFKDRPGSLTLVQRWIQIRNNGLKMDPDTQPWLKDESGFATLV
jgi:hypothetical protein